MMKSLADGYTDDVLGPQLRTLGLNNRQRSIVAADVRRRLNSLLAHWDDLVFRRTALLCGVEEATFYDPLCVALDVRALVVAAIRNSLIEDLGTSRPATQELGLRQRVLPDTHMPVITRAAIEYFDRHAPSQLPLAAVDAKYDVFGALALRFPGAWHALSTLANSTACEVAYEPLPSSPADLPGSGVSGQARNRLCTAESIRRLTRGCWAISVR